MPAVIYTPHNCELPDPEEMAVGTAIECECGDIWENQSLANAPVWVRFPSWKNK